MFGKKNTSESELLIQEYSKNPINNFAMGDSTIKRHEGNFICGDDITVYLKIENNVINKYSFDWNCSTITMAAASFLAEFVVGQKIQDVLFWDYEFLSRNWFEVSNRRKRAAVIGILAIRNAIHNYLNDGLLDDFDDLID